MESAERNGKQAAASQPSLPATSPFASGPAQRQEHKSSSNQQQQGQQQRRASMKMVTWNRTRSCRCRPTRRSRAGFVLARDLSRVAARGSDSPREQPAAASHVAVHVEVRARMPA